MSPLLNVTDKKDVFSGGKTTKDATVAAGAAQIQIMSYVQTVQQQPTDIQIHGVPLLAAHLTTAKDRAQNFTNHILPRMQENITDLTQFSN